MGNLVEIQQQIEKLQKQAREIKDREFGKTVAEILEKMAAFGITFNDLKKGQSSKRPAVKRASAKKAAGKPASSRSGKTVAAKYRGPNGEVWSGRGLMPRWLSTLVSQGQAKESFLIQA